MVGMNKIEDLGAENIAQALHQNSGLVYLCLQGSCIGDVGAKFIGNALARNKTLVELDLCIVRPIFKIAMNNISKEGVKALMAGLEENHTLRSLNLGALVQCQFVR
eukprot:TRINITY_DN409_c0_g1_i1.p7 TRINITY_DN409_c0_g1~~TRINITY_DN409_c0_g1_i1.p7  ORF type:complete len:106 (+),score=13.09 TRINITY_DN409_c0_g1_i1:1595-1912(+)